MTAGVSNPFNTLNGDAVWTHVQFAFSDSNVSTGDLTAYGANANNATNKAGPAVVFPTFVLPVAIAYNPIYGTNAAGAAMRYAVTKPQKINGVDAGGLPLSRSLYCKVFNGDITNFNDPLFKAANLNKTLQDTTNDTTTRWTTDGVPIRLVGRLDRSGTTDIFTRHLAKVCTGLTTTTNKYAKNAETLPYNPASGVNFSNIRADTGLATGNNNGGNYPNAADTTTTTTALNAVSGDYFGTAITYNGAGPTSAPTGNVGSGLFLVADGSGKLATAINLAPDYVLNGVTLNGKIGYIASDFVAPSQSAPAGNTLFSAALQINGTGTLYAMPSAANGVAAFGAGTSLLLPPQSTTTGAFNTTDTRQVPLPAGGNGNATRDNPIAWTQVLYASANNNLAAPVKGYSITGTTQYFGYTCYATTANRYNVVELLGLTFGKVNKTSANAPFSVNTFKGTGATMLGTFAQSNIGVVPAAWQSAITETFLKKSLQTSNGTPLATFGNGGNGLWLQSKYLLTANDANPAPSAADAQSNAGCTVGTGA